MAVVVTVARTVVVAVARTVVMASVLMVALLIGTQIIDLCDDNGADVDRTASTVMMTVMVAVMVSPMMRTVISSMVIASAASPSLFCDSQVGNCICHRNCIFVSSIGQSNEHG